MLEFTLPFVGILLSAGITERVGHALLLLFSLSKQSTLSEAKSLISHCLKLVSSAIFGSISLIFRSFAMLSSFVLFFILIFVVLSFIYVSYEEYPVVWIQGVAMYNEHVGPFIHSWFLLPLQVANLLLKGLIPIWNSLVHFFKMLWLKGLLPLVFPELRTAQAIGVALLELGQACSVSFGGYLDVAACKTELCFTQVPELDVLTPMKSVSRLSVLFGNLVGNVCSPVGGPVEIILYPFRNAHIANAVHQLVNAVLSTVVYLPIVTGKRCLEYGQKGGSSDVLMCTPDIEVPKVYVLAFVRALGNGLDDWFGAAYDFISGSHTVCQPGVTPDTFKSGILSGVTTTTGLTERLMVTTNGSYAAFFSPSVSNTGVSIKSWPATGIDVILGVAAVRYGSVDQIGVSGLSYGSVSGGSETSTLMGCMCLDSSEGLLIRCSFLPFYGSLNTSSAQFDVLWQDHTWRKQLKCSAVEITVRSVRWPVRRFVGSGQPSMGQPLLSCVTQGTCESVDATIWVVPKCQYLPAALCSYEATGTSCFPYCMATRKRGSMNQPPVLVSAGTWRNGMQLMDRECSGVSSGNQVGANFVLSSTAGTSSVSLLSSLLADYQNSLFVNSPKALGCSVGLQTVSWIHIPSGSTAGLNGLPFSLLNQQPFAIAGDAILIQQTMPDGGTRVHTGRLTGSQQNATRTTKAARDAQPYRPVGFRIDPRG